MEILDARDLLKYSIPLQICRKIVWLRGPISVSRAPWRVTRQPIRASHDESRARLTLVAIVAHLFSDSASNRVSFGPEDAFLGNVYEYDFRECFSKTRKRWPTVLRKSRVCWAKIAARPSRRTVGRRPTSRGCFRPRAKPSESRLTFRTSALQRWKYRRVAIGKKKPKRERGRYREIRVVVTRHFRGKLFRIMNESRASSLLYKRRAASTRHPRRGASGRGKTGAGCR